jgi:hypothetical protein
MTHLQGDLGMVRRERLHVQLQHKGVVAMAICSGARAITVTRAGRKCCLERKLWEKNGKQSSNINWGGFGHRQDWRAYNRGSNRQPNTTSHVQRTQQLPCEPTDGDTAAD